MDELPRFHSADALTNAKSEAIRDEVFMRAFLCKAIDVPELQTHTKELATDMKVPWMKIFLRIQKDHRSIESNEALRSRGEPLLKRKALRVAKFNPSSK